jgi:hypothetical protein
MRQRTQAGHPRGCGTGCTEAELPRVCARKIKHVVHAGSRPAVLLGLVCARAVCCASSRGHSTTDWLFVELQ